MKEEELNIVLPKAENVLASIQQFNPKNTRELTLLQHIDTMCNLFCAYREYICNISDEVDLSQYETTLIKSLRIVLANSELTKSARKQLEEEVVKHTYTLKTLETSKAEYKLHTYVHLKHHIKAQKHIKKLVKSAQGSKLSK